MDKEILTTTDAAKLLGVSVRTAQLLIEGGSIPSWKTPGGHRRVYRRDVVAVIPAAAPVPARASALVVLVAPPHRLAAYEALLALLPCTVEAFTDVHAAVFAIGSRLPAVVVMEMAEADAGRVAVLESLRANPALGATQIIVVGCSAAVRGDGAGHPHAARIRRVDGPAAVPAAVEAALRAGSTSASPFETPPPFPIPANEGQRLLALERSGLVDTPPEDSFDRLTWLAARSLEAPVALLTLLTPDRQWFKSRHGLDMSETPRSWAFCNHTILQNGLMVAEDLSTDRRFADNPAVTGGPLFRFYAGAPVVDPDGFMLGSLCVIDTRPRTLDDGQKQVLSNLAALASDEIRLRATDRQLRWALEALHRQGG